MSLDETKQRFREQAQIRRKSVARAASAQAPQALADNFLDVMPPMNAGSVISGYLAIGDEMPVTPLLEKLIQSNHVACLPVVIKTGHPLLFRTWSPGLVLEDGPLKTRHPGPEQSETEPDILLVPMLAFDERGHRMGWGGGYYDRTLQALRQKKHVLGVGVAFEGQRVDAVPNGPYDQPLDWVVTEITAHQIK